MKTFSVIILTSVAAYIHGICNPEPISCGGIRYEYKSAAIDTTTLPVDSILNEMVAKNGLLLDEVQVISYGVPLIEKDISSSVKTSQVQEEISIRGSRVPSNFYYIDGVRVSSSNSSIPKPEYEVARKKINIETESITVKTSLPTKSISQIAATTSGVSDDNITIRESRQNTIHFSSSGVRIGPIVDGIIMSDEQSAKVIPQAEYNQVSAHLEVESAGLLTAAEWNDLDNWNDWHDLTKDGVYTSMLDYWQLPMGNRESVFVMNHDSIPIPNCKVDLLDAKGNLLWESMTDHYGRSELWHPIGATGSELVVRTRDEVMVQPLNASRTYSETTAITSTECFTHDDIDIMFVVDATGSMEDEIAYLRTELADVISRVSTDQNTIIRTGAVFYKDKWDDYLTSVSHLNDKVSVTTEFMSRQKIGGGGDYPEAMDEGLEEALVQDWNPSALSRIIFLLLDAPPHDDPEVMERLERQVREAAKRGIKIIPITASGINRETEYLMKQMAMMTNGTYVFLTDDSGIGDTHMVHAIPDYDVEQLNDLLVRLIGQYGNQVSCDYYEDENVAKVSADTDVENIEVTMFPNPAHESVTIKSNVSIGQILLLSNTGKRIKTITVDGSETSLDVSDIVSGIYAVALVNKSGKQIASKQLVVMH